MGRIKCGGGNGGEPARSPPGQQSYAVRRPLSRSIGSIRLAGRKNGRRTVVLRPSFLIAVSRLDQIILGSTVMDKKSHLSEDFVGTGSLPFKLSLQTNVITPVSDDSLSQ